ncbi:MAG: Eco57I restriction-modification methylase domain-containing protein [bacterium]
MNLLSFKTNIVEGIKNLFNDLNIPVNPITELKERPENILKKTFNPENESFKLMEAVYPYGLVDDSAFEKERELKLDDISEKYEAIAVFGVKLAKRENDLLPTRKIFADITRAFNREFKYTPVVVVFKYQGFITIASSERSEYAQKWREGEKIGKITLLRDIDIENTHAGHLKILEELKIPASSRNKVNSFATLHELWQKVFDVSILNEKFYRELSNWYFWAMDRVKFPDDAEKREDIRNATNLIRLITRIVFIWFIKEKNLVPEKLFNKEEVSDIIVDFNKDKSSGNYYKAILQNLFFGTLNQKMGERKFAEDGGHEDRDTNRKEYGVKTLWRYDSLFKIPQQEAEKLFKNIPFLNGGLFDCLDKDNDMNRTIYVDGFSRNPGKQAFIPDYLFFGEKEEMDLNEIYGTKNKKYFVEGLINILDSYKFTIAENTPTEEDVALDPELLGKVFENLLASYNPETKTTARKQTGSFYTPREIVNYMVDESLIAYLKAKLNDETDKTDKLLHRLFKHDDDQPFEDKETVLKIIKAFDEIKIFDPAVGSGAFPMGILNKVVHVLSKLNPDNSEWQELQLQKVDKKMAKTTNQAELKELDKLKIDIIKAFEDNEADYPRKLYLIENCIYGVDIQPIAIQICKLRFFISLIVDQKVDRRKDNYGIRPLPNLETKFVAANTLIGLEKPDQSGLSDIFIQPLKEALLKVRHEHFSAKTRNEKLDCAKRDKEIRKQIAKVLIENHYKAIDANKIADFDLYDQNKSSDWFDPEWMFGIKDGFDVVIGNPPYMRVQTLQQTQPEYMQFYRDNFKSAKGSFDIYALFVECGIKLANKIGQLVYILPHKFFQAAFGVELRKMLTKQKALRQIVRFGAEQVFDEATTYTCLLFLSNKQQSTFDLFEVTALSNSILNAVQDKLEHPNYAKGTLDAPKDENWQFSIGENNKVMQRLLQHKTTLGNITRKIFQGIATSSDKIFVLKIVDDFGDTIRCYSQHLDEEIEIEKGLIRPFLMGKDVHRYETPVPKNVVIFPYWLNDNKAQLMTQEEIKNNFPLGWKYILKNKNPLENREHGRFSENWWCFSRPQNMTEFLSVKIMTPDICNKPEMTIDESSLIYHTTTVYSFVFNEKALYTPKFYLGLLNSKVMWYFLSQTGTVLRGGYMRFKTEYLKPFPIPKADENQQKAIEALVSYILFLKKHNENTPIILMFETIINSIVYDLYFEEETRVHELYVSNFVYRMLPKLKLEMNEAEKLQICEKAYKNLKNNTAITHTIISRNNSNLIKTIQEANNVKN